MTFAPVMREFKDFVVGCDNTGGCSVVGVPADHEEGMALVLRREAGEPSPARLALVAGDDLHAASLFLDGKALPTHGAWRPAEDSTSLVFAGDIANLLAQIREGQVLSLGAGDDHRASLAGLEAALLFVDEHQGRLGTPGAWIEKGTASTAIPPAAPAPALPAAPDPGPAMTDAQQRALLAYVRKQDGAALAVAAKALGVDACDPASDDADGTAVFALTATDVLVAVPCLGGAYQSSYVVFRVDRAMQSPPVAIELPPSPLREAGDSTAPGLLTEPDYASGMLSSFDKARGLGDCGELRRWRFDGQRFVLAWDARLDRCGGVTSDDWPVLWRTSNTNPGG